MPKTSAPKTSAKSSSPWLELANKLYQTAEIDLDDLQRKCDELGEDGMDRRIAVDQALRECLFNHVAPAVHSNKFNMDHFETFVTKCIDVSRRELCTATMPVVLLGDMFDAFTLDRSEQLFAYVEKNVSTWKEELFFKACKNNLLRMCNDLLRRLSRSQNTVFCGRILLFLAKFFPFSERSGLNIVSEFNIENVTEFGGEASGELRENFAETEDADAEDELKSDIKINIDFNLYSKFWSLQDFFRNPNQCYSKVSWKTFAAHASSVLSAFSSFKLDEVVDCKRPKLDQPAVTPMETDDSNEEAGTTPQKFFPKYLTNQKLLELQLSDSNFRRYVLLQFLILFQYLDSQVKFKAETFELNPEQTEWVKETTEKICILISETPPDGPAFLQAVKHILRREELWNNWKNDGCQSLKMPSAAVLDETEETVAAVPEKRKLPRRPKRPLGDVVRDAVAQNKTVMGNPELTKLWNLCPDNLEACRAKDRDFLPSLEVYFEEAIEQTDPTAMVEDSYKRVNDGAFGWRALRLMARRSPHFFTHSNNNIYKLPEYLETMIKKIAKDRPNAGAQNTPNEEVKVDVLETEAQSNENEAEDDEILKEENLGRDRKDKDDGSNVPKPLAFTDTLLDSLAATLTKDWKKLAVKLAFKPDEIEYLMTTFSEDLDRARNLLQLYKDNEEDASPENLEYTLEGLELNEAAQVIKDVAKAQQ